MVLIQVLSGRRYRLLSVVIRERRLMERVQIRPRCMQSKLPKKAESKA
jgi:hypothetical protein